MSSILTITFEIPEKLALVCIDSLKIEADSDATRRSKIDLSYSNNRLAIKITADDLHALRAALNTYMRWIMMCCELMDANKTST